MDRTSGRIMVEQDVEIAYTECGAGQPVLMIPGWTMTGDVFEHQLEGMGPDFRAVTFDPEAKAVRRTPLPATTTLATVKTWRRLSRPWICGR